MFKKIGLSFLVLSLVLCGTAHARIQIKPFDKSGVSVSGDLTVPCPSGQVMLSSGSGSWACGSVSTAPTDATYITQTSNGTLSNAQPLASLSTGIMRVATTTGVVTSLTDSSGIASNILDETGSGVIVFGTSPTIATPVLTLEDGNGAAPTTDGRIKYDRTTERLQVGDGSGTKSFVPGGTMTDTKYCIYDSASVSIVCNSTVSSSPWTDSGTVSYLTDTTDELVLGGSAALSSAKFSIDGDTDQIQQIVQGNATQTSALQVWETSAGTDVAQVNTTGFSAATGTAAAPFYNFISNPTTGMFLNSTRWGISLGGTQIIQCINDPTDGCHVGEGNASSAIRFEVSPAATTQNGLVIAAKNLTSADLINVYDEGLRSFFRVDGVGGTEANVLTGDGAIATSATDGFLYIATAAGAPSGTPTAYTGMAPMVYDSTNNKICVYDGGWLCTAALT